MGFMTINEGREIMQLPPIPGGDARVIRGEYYLIDDENNIIAESGGHNGNEVGTTGWYDDDLDDPDNQNRPARDGDGDGIIGE